MLVTADSRGSLPGLLVVTKLTKTIHGVRRQSTMTPSMWANSQIAIELFPVYIQSTATIIAADRICGDAVIYADVTQISQSAGAHWAPCRVSHIERFSLVLAAACQRGIPPRMSVAAKPRFRFVTWRAKARLRRVVATDSKTSTRSRDRRGDVRPLSVPSASDLMFRWQACLIQREISSSDRLHTLVK